MKKVLYGILWICAVQMSITACEEEPGDLAAPPEAADASFTFAPTAENDNIIQFSSTSPAFLKKWTFGNGASAEGNSPKATFPVKGTYEVVLTAYTAGGSVTSKQTIEIAETDPTLLDIPVYNFLTGGVAAVDGKTWIVDKESSGHLGIGPVKKDDGSDGTGPDWYSAAPNEKNNKNLYDDEMTFKLAGFAFKYESHGTIYANGAFASVLPGAVIESGGGADLFAPYNGPANQTWSMVESAPGKFFLTIGSAGHLGYFTGSSTYEILSINADELWVRTVQGGAPNNFWYQKFIRKGFVRTPPEEPKPKPYKIDNIAQNFDGQGNAAFVGDANGSVVTYDNPAPVPINTSAKVGKYVKANGPAGEYANVQIPLDYRLDLRTRHVFKLKVFIPSYNDYTTIGGEDWQSYKTLQKQVSMKLQNSLLGGNAYTTQVEVIQKNLETDKWVELTFDFAAHSAREDFDKVVIQIG
jgi:PKD repeat protein